MAGKDMAGDNDDGDRKLPEELSSQKGDSKEEPSSRRLWTEREDEILEDYVRKNGEGNWNTVQKNTGLRRDDKSCRYRWTHHVRHNLKKGPIITDGSNDGYKSRLPWTPREDEILKDYVKKYGEGKWKAVEKNTGLRRSGRSCENRWRVHLRPDRKKGLFTDEELRTIMRLRDTLGNSWSAIAEQLPGRSAIEIQSYWNSIEGVYRITDSERLQSSTSNVNYNIDFNALREEFINPDRQLQHLKNLNPNPTQSINSTNFSYLEPQAQHQYGIDNSNAVIPIQENTSPLLAGGSDDLDRAPIPAHAYSSWQPESPEQRNRTPNDYVNRTGVQSYDDGLLCENARDVHFTGSTGFPYTSPVAQARPQYDMYNSNQQLAGSSEIFSSPIQEDRSSFINPLSAREYDPQAQAYSFTQPENMLHNRTMYDSIDDLLHENPSSTGFSYTSPVAQAQPQNDMYNNNQQLVGSTEILRRPIQEDSSFRNLLPAQGCDESARAPAHAYSSLQQEFVEQGNRMSNEYANESRIPSYDDGLLCGNALDVDYTGSPGLTYTYPLTHGQQQYGVHHNNEQLHASEYDAHAHASEYDARVSEIGHHSMMLNNNVDGLLPENPQGAGFTDSTVAHPMEAQVSTSAQINPNQEHDQSAQFDQRGLQMAAPRNYSVTDANKNNPNSQRN
ncbi:myb-like DNA-binding protein BAS1 isoform X3 [Asparagus officinalis]|uniref:myb-like DNA-binding protein BAS1 isoform X3 n=1 Tax=Asparagus officinalis TaxID=4686 RepID=UPI00098E5798|nr:myb-like DNA-binding protein BAS1 isoform X3 [Asparagus officinalis]